MTIRGALAPATELARQDGARFPNESEEYRSAGDALLAEEIELRRQIERVAGAPGVAAWRRSDHRLPLRRREWTDKAG
jgi:predicted dithiol-disulfide oxidoreductase (DUF899 family)